MYNDYVRGGSLTEPYNGDKINREPVFISGGFRYVFAKHTTKIILSPRKPPEISTGSFYLSGWSETPHTVPEHFEQWGYERIS